MGATIHIPPLPRPYLWCYYVVTWNEERALDKSTKLILVSSVKIVCS